ncbi:hypothetical protein PL9631_650007 [Planktothrix paucivesiculata PCC 9631]|uniref:Uncharacterized protein n=1 Tax=Planktothrix paucivesiculata PCC 9631 TaxID=671071 RepID=A0A7Z9E101_9CYAN|nr:hypothetical protein PL9631_650007 [Planktothrix paucivesiculata PCC 9631]
MTKKNLKPLQAAIMGRLQIDQIQPFQATCNVFGSGKDLPIFS